MGQDAQADWGEAEVEIAGVRVMVQFLAMRLNHSRARFVIAFPFQKQEAFFEGHIQAFRFFGGVPQQITYDNLKTAVFQVLKGHNRREQQAFTGFRSHYLFDSYYCMPGQGHEKGGIENDVGFIQRNFFSPLLKVSSFAELNTYLWQACLTNAERRVRGADQTVVEQWEAEKAFLLPRPTTDYQACTTHAVKPNPYSQVVFETNRYSVPTEYLSAACGAAGLRVSRGNPGPRCGYCRPTRVAWAASRTSWNRCTTSGCWRNGPAPSSMPSRCAGGGPSGRRSTSGSCSNCGPPGQTGRGLREFLAILKLHLDHPAEHVEQAIHAALALGAAHLDGVELCLRQLETPRTRRWPSI